MTDFPYTSCCACCLQRAGILCVLVLQIVVQALQCSHYSILWQLVKITEGSPSKVSGHLIIQILLTEHNLPKKVLHLVSL